MEKIQVTNADDFVREFIKEYLADGMGAIPKHEIDILVMNLLMKYGELAYKSNYELSILLQTTESRIKRLRYEARLKYPPDEDYVRREFLYVLGRAQFELDKKDGADISKMKIIFVLEDNFLRYAIQGKLKEQGMFADTSFNSELVRIECGSLVSIIQQLYGKKVAKEFQEGFQTLNQPESGEGMKAFKAVMFKFILDTAQSVLSAVVAAELKTRLGIV